MQFLGKHRLHSKVTREQTKTKTTVIVFFCVYDIASLQTNLITYEAAFAVLQCWVQEPYFITCNYIKIAISGNPEKCCIVQANSEHIHYSGVFDWLWPDFAIVTPEKGGRGWKLHMYVDIYTQHSKALLQNGVFICCKEESKIYEISKIWILHCKHDSKTLSVKKFFAVQRVI